MGAQRTTVYLEVSLSARTAASATSDLPRLSTMPGMSTHLSDASAGVPRLPALPGMPAHLPDASAGLPRLSALPGMPAGLSATATVPAVAQLQSATAACYMLVSGPIRRYAVQHCMEIWRDHMAASAVE